MNDRSLRFCDSNLQERLLSELHKTDITFVVESDATVCCSESEYARVTDIAHKIRDSCFRWYFRWSDDTGWAVAFWEELKAAHLPFHVEYHNRNIAFLLPKGSEELHSELSNRAHEASTSNRG